MSIVYILLPLSLLLALCGLAGYIWALKNGQFDDLDTPSRRILFDSSDPKGDPESNSEA